ncbi:hypothetical protein NUW58_g3716 [Xylaria curta]|uniref:Uncharacterized protein n=1 Tax=Xylaria curta TaxID=42375 RepID=A0ACC1PCA1_9PEZI|nr:hypothetical protein NUW58_g3716 [Xylaria curta]
MERLPQELVAKVAGYLPDRHEGKRIRPALATLSHSWQYAIETLTFKSLHITSDQLGRFFSVFANPVARRDFLRDLHLDVVLPRYSDEDCAKYETVDDRAANSHVFSHHISALLQELSQWPSGGKLNLVVGMYSLMDGAHRGLDKFDHDRYEVSVGRRHDIFDDRYRYSYIRVTDAFPAVVPCVTSFYVHSGPRFLDPASLVALTAAFPNLERINWPYEDPVYFPALRRQQMHEFASAVASFQPPPACKTCTYILTCRGTHTRRDFRISIPATRLDYEGPIDPTLFWALRGPSLDTDDTCSWKSLLVFKGLPGDRFYDEESDVPLPPDAEGLPLLLPPGYYDSDEQNAAAAAAAKSMEMPEDDEGFIVEGCEFRWLPRDEAVLPLLAAVARRLTRTPSLQSVYLETALPRDKGVWFFSYQAPGEMSDWDEYVDCEGSACNDPLSRARVFLHAEDWRPDEGSVAMLRGIGKVCYGEDAIVTFLPSLY